MTTSPVDLPHTAMFTSTGREDPYPLLEGLHQYGDHVHMPEGYLAVWG